MRGSVNTRVAIGLAVALVALGVGVAVFRGLGSRPSLQSVGPRLVSNQTSQPLSVVGSGLRPGIRLRVGGQLVPLAVIDDRHAYGRLQPVPVPAAEPQQTFQAALEDGEGTAPLTVVNDAAFPDLTALAVRADGHVFAASTTTDELFELDPETGAISRHATFDGPTALACWGSTLVVTHRFDSRLMLLKATGEVQPVPAAANAEAVAVDGLGVAFVAEHARDTVLAVDLPSSGRLLWRREVDPNPKGLALLRGQLAVGSLQTGEVELLSTDTGERQAVIAPRPGTPILGGGTADFSRYVMGGKAQRGLAFASGHLFSANSGPNVGPNPKRMEVSANGGVSELDPQGGTVLRHRGFGAGVTSSVVADEAAGVLYAADPALGLVRVVDLKTLELKQEIPIPAPDGFPSIRPAAELGVQKNARSRAGPELHSGPTALALDGARKRLWVLDRFTGTAAAIDLSRGALLKQWPLADTLKQRERRLGQVLYFADVGRTSMSCDGCHLEGHTEGVFFEKTHPLRIYRATTVRGSRETPPYFTPASTFSLAETASVVGGRNRYHNPDPSPPEVEALALYTAGVTTLPNPFVGADGAPVPGELELFDHQRGRPREGLKLFEAHCQSCHPPPHFTTDQDPSTRGRYLDVGTPEALPLRVEMQELVGRGMAPPSLLGAWDIFPMLSSGSAGLKVVDGDRLEVGARFALRDVVETHGGPRHGGSAALTAQERNDLLAYLLSL